MRRFRSRLVVLGLTAIVGLFYPLLAPTAHRIDLEHFELLKEGMTRAEVEAIFGVPAGKYDWAEPDQVRLWYKVFSAYPRCNSQPPAWWSGRKRLPFKPSS